MLLSHSAYIGVRDRGRCFHNVRDALPPHFVFHVTHSDTCLFRFVGLGEDPQVLAQRAPELFGVSCVVGSPSEKLKLIRLAV